MKMNVQNQSKLKFPSLLLLLALASSAIAETKLPVDAATKKVVFKTTLPLRTGVSTDAAFSLAEEWFKSNREQFSRTNRSVSSSSERATFAAQHQAVDKEFENNTPLQSLDPASNRLVGKIIMQYHGNPGGTIHHLYVQCNLILEIEDHQLQLRVTDITYNHFNRNSYQPQRFLNYSNSNACDAVNYIEYLMDCEQSQGEFSVFNEFFNQDVKALFSNLDTYMKGNKALTLNSPSEN